MLDLIDIKFHLMLYYKLSYTCTLNVVYVVFFQNVKVPSPVHHTVLCRPIFNTFVKYTLTLIIEGVKTVDTPTQKSVNGKNVD